MTSSGAELAPEAIRDAIAAALDDGKAENVCVLNVRDLTSITDYMIVASGRSSRQVKALKDRILEAMREQDLRPIGIEGEQAGEWVLIDFGDVIVHVMLPDTRDFYQLEKLWDTRARDESSQESTLDTQ